MNSVFFGWQADLQPPLASTHNAKESRSTGSGLCGSLNKNGEPSSQMYELQKMKESVNLRYCKAS